MPPSPLQVAGANLRETLLSDGSIGFYLDNPQANDGPVVFIATDPKWGQVALLLRNNTAAAVHLDPATLMALYPWPLLTDDEIGKIRIVSPDWAARPVAGEDKHVHLEIRPKLPLVLAPNQTMTIQLDGVLASGAATHGRFVVEYTAARGARKLTQRLPVTRQYPPDRPNSWVPGIQFGSRNDYGGPTDLGRTIYVTPWAVTQARSSIKNVFELEISANLQIPAPRFSIAFLTGDSNASLCSDDDIKVVISGIDDGSDRWEVAKDTTTPLPVFNVTPKAGTTSFGGAEVIGVRFSNLASTLPSGPATPVLVQYSGIHADVNGYNDGLVVEFLDKIDPVPFVRSFTAWVGSTQVPEAGQVNYGPVQLKWDVFAAENCLVVEKMALLGPADSLSVTADQPTKQFTLQPQVGNTQFNSRTFVFTVTPPSFNYFRSDPGAVAPGASSTLSWSFGNGARVQVKRNDNGAVIYDQNALTGSCTVNPSADTGYTATCFGAGSLPSNASVAVPPVQAGIQASGTVWYTRDTPSPIVPNPFGPLLGQRSEALSADDSERPALGGAIDITVNWSLTVSWGTSYADSCVVQWLDTGQTISTDLGGSWQTSGSVPALAPRNFPRQFRITAAGRGSSQSTVTASYKTSLHPVIGMSLGENPPFGPRQMALAQPRKFTGDGQTAKVMTSADAGEILLAQPPIGFDVVNAQGNAVVYISDDANWGQLTLRLQNNTAAPIALDASSVVKFYPGPLLNNGEIGKIELIAAGFKMTPVAGAGQQLHLELRPAGALTFACGEDGRLEMKFGSVFASGVATPGRFLVEYHGFGTLEDGTQRIPVMRQLPPGQGKDWPLTPAFGARTDYGGNKDQGNAIFVTPWPESDQAAISNYFILELMASEVVEFGDARPAIMMSFLSGDGDASLCSDVDIGKLAAGVDQDPGDPWQVTKDGTGPFPVFTISPGPQTRTFGTEGPLAIKFSNLASTLPSGKSSLIFIQYTGLSEAGYNDGFAVHNIDKTDPVPFVRSFAAYVADQAVAQEGTVNFVPVQLRWDVFAAQNCLIQPNRLVGQPSGHLDITLTEPVMTFTMQPQVGTREAGTSTVQFNVTAPEVGPPQANPDAVAPGGTSELSWSCSNGDHCRLIASDGSLSLDGLPLIGHRTVTVGQVDTTYTVTCVGAGVASASKTIRVPPPTAQIQVSGSWHTTRGRSTEGVTTYWSVTVNWSTTFATGCAVTCLDDGQVVSNNLQGPWSTSGSNFGSSPNAPRSFRITADGRGSAQQDGRW